MIALAKFVRVLYALLLVVAGLYALLLLLASMLGRQSTQNTLIYACGILFIARAIFASRTTILRARAANVLAEPRRISRYFLIFGDAIAIASLLRTAQIFWTVDHRLGTPVVPFGIGLAGAGLMYLIAVCLQFSEGNRLS